MWCPYDSFGISIYFNIHRAHWHFNIVAIEQILTCYQINHILSYFSIQTSSSYHLKVAWFLDLAASFGWLFDTIIERENRHSNRITMLPLTLLIGLFIWNNRIESYRIGNFNYTVASADDRSGGFPKFPQSFVLVNNQNQFYHQFYFPSKNHEDIPTHQNTCGTRSVQFNPKRSGKIIGGNCQIKVHLFSSIKSSWMVWSYSK